MEEGEVLDYDSSAYDMFHQMTMEWPCLSFDIIPDTLGDNRGTVCPSSSHLHLNLNSTHTPYTLSEEHKPITSPPTNFSSRKLHNCIVQNTMMIRITRTKKMKTWTMRQRWTTALSATPAR